MKNLFNLVIIGTSLLGFQQLHGQQCLGTASSLPPAMPKAILGDIEVCKGNNKASYEVSEIDASVCDYEWSGLPVTAKIWAKEAIPNTNPTAYKSGQGMYKILVDWGSTPPGEYTLKLIAKNTDASGNWQTSVARAVNVKVKFCGFDISPQPVCPNNPVIFMPGPMTAISKYVWDNGKFGAQSGERFYTSTTNEPYRTTYTAAGVYQVSLKTIDYSGQESFYYNTLNVIDCNPLNIENNQSENNQFKIYPNPSNGNVLLQFPKAQKAQLEVLDAQLRVVKSQEVDFASQPAEVNLSELSNGIYFLKISNQVSKIIINK